MAGPTPDFSTVTVVWEKTLLDGTAPKGNIEIAYDGAEQLDPSPQNPIGIIPTTFTQPIVEFTIQVADKNDVLQTIKIGRATFELPASNDPDISGGGGTYTVTEKLTNASGRAYSFVADKDAPGGIIKLAEATPIDTTPGVPATVVTVAQLLALTDRVTALESNSTGFTINADSITDATATGRGVIRAATAAAARTAIGALGAGMSLDSTADSATRLAMTAAERTKLADLSGAVYIATTNATLPALADNTLVALYSALIAGTPVVTAAGTNTSVTAATTITVVTTVAIPAGDVIVVGLSRGVTGTTTGGTAAVTLSAGAVGAWSRASAQRTGVAESDGMAAVVTTTIPSGTTVTITTTGNSTNRAIAAVAGIHLLDSATPNATSGDDAAGVLGTSSAGANASAATLTASTDAATTNANCLVIGFFAFNSSVTWSFPGGTTQIANLATAAGSSDRGLAIGYKIATATGVQSVVANGSASGAVCGAVLALPIALVEA